MTNELTLKIRLIPDDETMAVILAMLNLWQDANRDHMVAIVPAKDGYKYEIIQKRMANDDRVQKADFE